MEKELRSFLDQLESCLITTDCWKSMSNENYLTITCHLTDVDFKLRSLVMTTSKVVNELIYKSENIAESQSMFLHIWNILQNVSCIVTDKEDFCL